MRLQMAYGSIEDREYFPWWKDQEKREKEVIQYKKHLATCARKRKLRKKRKK